MDYNTTMIALSAVQYYYMFYDEQRGASTFITILTEQNKIKISRHSEQFAIIV